MVLVASGILVSAADAAVPGDWMYGVDRAMDGLRVRLALDPKQKAQVERQLAQERLHEAQMLTQRGEPSNVELLRQESRKALLAAKAADPHATRKAEKPAAKILAPAQVEPNERQLEQTRPAKGDPYCSGKAARHQPAGEKLAQRLGVNYGEVMRWYCQGYKMSEIGLAYRISRTTGVGVDQVFARRLNGLGWGEIMKKYGLNGKEE
jgi:hypothetical protein